MEKRSFVLLGIIAAAACVPRPPAPPPARPLPAAPPRAPLPPPQPAASDWRDVPLTPGGWAYEDRGATQEARFGGTDDAPLFTLRCERGQVTLSRHGIAGAASMTVRTSFTARSLAATAGGQPASVSASVRPNDAILDSIAFSRGRFTVELGGSPMLVVPSWPEPARVIEDCRR